MTTVDLQTAGVNQSFPDFSQASAEDVLNWAPCTRAVKPGGDARAGRWWWERSEQKECSLHFNDDALEKELLISNSGERADSE